MATTDEPTLDPRIAPDLREVRKWALIVGAAGIVLGLIVGLIQNRDLRHFFHAYLIGYELFLGLTLGCLAVGMLGSVVGGRWSQVVAPTLAAGASAIPLTALLFIPLLFNLGANYPWARQTWQLDEVLRHEHPWFNLGFFLIRAVIYFALWWALAYALNVWAHRREMGHLLGSDDVTAFTGPGILIYGLTATFASVDWVMCVEPRWYSSIFGMSYVVGQSLTGLAFAILAVAFFARLIGQRPKGDEFGRVSLAMSGAGEPAKGPLVAPTDFGDLGNLMLAMVMLWAYLAFSQFLIQWAGNLPDENQYYMPRLFTGWRWVGLGLIIGHFAIPFFTLFSRDAKRDGRTLAKLAAFVLVMRFIDWLWIVEPSVRAHDRTWAVKDQPQFGGWIFTDILVTIGLGGLWVAWFTWRVRGRTVLPLPAVDPHGHAAHAEPAGRTGAHGAAGAGGPHV